MATKATNYKGNALFRLRREAVQGSAAPTNKEIMEQRYAPARPM